MKKWEEPPTVDAHGKNVFRAQYAAGAVAEILDNPLERHRPKRVISAYFYEDRAEWRDPENAVFLEIEKEAEDEVYLRVGAFRIGEDQAYTNFLTEAGTTPDEVKCWLRNTDICVPLILEREKTLSNQVDRNA